MLCQPGASSSQNEERAICLQGLQLMCWEYNSFIQLLHKEIVLSGEKTTMDLKMLKLLVFKVGQSFLIVDIDGTIETVNEADPEISRV